MIQTKIYQGRVICIEVGNSLIKVKDGRGFEQKDSRDTRGLVCPITSCTRWCLPRLSYLICLFSA